MIMKYNKNIILINVLITFIHLFDIFYISTLMSAVKYENFKFIRCSEFDLCSIFYHLFIISIHFNGPLKWLLYDQQEQ